MFGLIGFPLSHSFSKEYFQKKFKNHQIDEEYELFPIREINDICILLNKNIKKLRGLNVTIPYKESVLKYLTDIDSDAKAIGAVNVIKICEKDGIPVLIGYNTDWKGFLSSLLPLLNGKSISNALILGTGGASKAIAYALRKIGIKCSFVSRSIDKGDYSYNNLDNKAIASHQLIVNTTPLGTFPNVSTCPDIPYEAISRNHICYDLVYNPEQTEFLRKCEANGATVKNGLEMLYNQADLAWEIWIDRV